MIWATRELKVAVLGLLEEKAGEQLYIWDKR